MQEICERCGAWRPDQIIAPDGRSMSCPACGFVSPLRRGPLFVVTGASGAGKSTALRLLYQEERDYLVMESDILWEDRWQDPEGRYTAYFNLWLRVCKNIGQGGRPVVLGGCMAPHQLEPCVERRYFSAVHYLALVAAPEELRRRLQSRPAWRRCGAAGMRARLPPPCSITPGCGRTPAAPTLRWLCWIPRASPRRRPRRPLTALSAPASRRGSRGASPPRGPAGDARKFIHAGGARRLSKGRSWYDRFVPLHREHLPQPDGRGPDAPRA